MEKFYKLFTIWMVVMSTTILKSQTVYNNPTGTFTITCGDNKFYDIGGSGGTYGANRNQITTFYAPAGSCLQIKFTDFQTENGYDFLYVHNGPTTGSPLIATLTGGGSPQLFYTGVGGSITFRFTSDASFNNFRGFSANVTCACTPTLSAPQADCSNAVPLCDVAYFASGNTGAGSTNDLPAGVRGCLTTGEKNTSWYYIYVTSNGTLQMTIYPSPITKDYDFALYKVANGCPTGLPVRCSYSAPGGNTGINTNINFLTSTPGDVTEDNTTGDNWVDDLNVIAGERYVLIVGDYTNAGASTAYISLYGSAGFSCSAPPPNVTANPAVITCTNLTPTLSATSTNTAVTYSWAGPGIVSGGNTSTPTVNAIGVYTVTVTDPGTLATNTATAAVTQNTTPPSATATGGTLTCTNTTVTLLGGPASGVTYSWTGVGLTGATNLANATATTTGNYTLTTTSTVNGCTNTAVAAVTVNTTVPQISVGPDLVITCVTPTVTLSGSSSTSGATYAWTGPTGGTPAGATPTNSTSVVSAAGVYTLTVTNPANGCKSTLTEAVTSNVTPPNITVGSSQTITCSSSTAILTGSSTVSPVNYSWTGPTGGTPAGTTPTNSTTTVSSSGTYTLIITNPANSCTNSAVVSVTQNNTPPVVTSAVSGVLNCTLTSVNVSATTTTTPVAYNWSGPGITAGAGTGTITVNQSGSYNYTVTNLSNDCQTVGSQSVTQNITPPVANAGSTQTLVCGVSSVTLSGSATPAGSTANWVGGVCGTATSFTTTACAPGTYTLVATHPLSGCTNAATVAVNSSTDVPQAMVNAITNSITCTNFVVTIGVTLSNSDPVTYSWTGPGITGATNTATTTVNAGGNYSVTITNSITSCQSVYGAFVPTNTTAVTASVSPSASLTCLVSTSTLAATPTGTNYAYSWSGPGTIVNGTTENPIVNTGGDYVVTITNSINGCVGSYTVTVPTNTTIPTLSLTANSVTTTCASPNAALLATSNADPNASYTWTVPVTGTLDNTTINNPTATGSGIFTVAVTNTVNGCVSAQQTVTVTADANIPILTASSSNTAICTGASSTLSITGADTYTWSANAGSATTTTVIVTPTTTTTYSVTGTNTLTGCINVANIVINVNTTPTVNIAATSTVVCEGNTATLTLSGASNYTITNPAITTTSTLIVTPTTQTTYTIVGESSGCGSATQTITINVNALPIIAIANQTSCAGSPVTLSASGTDSYTWTPTGTTTGTISVTPTNNASYSVTGTNTLTGCTSTITTVDVTVNALPTVTATANPNTTCTSGTVNLNATGSSSSLSYTWTLGNGIDGTNQNQSTITFPASGLTTGTYIYTLTVTSSDDCISLPVTTTVNIIDVPNANFDLSDLSVCQNASGSISINTPQTGVSYDWTIGGINITNSNPVQVPGSATGTVGTFTVSVLSSIGSCTNTASNTLTVTALPTVILINNNISSCENTSVQLDVLNPNTAYIYTWIYNGLSVSNGTSVVANPLTQSNSGTYTVTVTDANGCVNKTTGVIDIQLCETYVPEIFTPNGDGKNDGFVIKNIENYPNNKLKIFNRWGNIIYQKDSYLNEFEGFANTGDAAGKAKLPSGTYYVILEYGDDKTDTYNGYLLLQY